MGGLRKRIPVTFWTMTMGVFAIAGIPPLAGFFSKDEILYQAFISPNPFGKVLWAVGLLAAFITSFYMFRLWFKTFFGPERFDEHSLGAPHPDAAPGAPEHDEAQVASHASVHESPWIMLLPLVILAILSVTGGWLGIPAALGGGNHFEHFLEPVFNAGSRVEAAPSESQISHSLELILAAVSVLVALAGLGLAWFFYGNQQQRGAALARRAPGPYNLVANKFYIDEIFNAVFVTGLLGFTRIFLRGFDRLAVDGFGGLATWVTTDFGQAARRIQSGNIRSYAGWLALGAGAVMAIMIFGRALWPHLPR